MSETSEAREIGAVHTGCPNCGAQLPVVEQPDGSLVPSLCSTCHGGAGEKPQGQSGDQGQRQGGERQTPSDADDNGSGSTPADEKGGEK